MEIVKKLHAHAAVVNEDLEDDPNTPHETAFVALINEHLSKPDSFNLDERILLLEAVEKDLKIDDIPSPLLGYTAWDLTRILGLYFTTPPYTVEDTAPYTTVTKKEHENAHVNQQHERHHHQLAQIHKISQRLLRYVATHTSGKEMVMCVSELLTEAVAGFGVVDRDHAQPETSEDEDDALGDIVEGDEGNEKEKKGTMNYVRSFYHAVVRFIEYGHVLAIALHRVRTMRLSSFIESSFPLILRGLQAFPILRELASNLKDQNSETEWEETTYQEQSKIAGLLRDQLLQFYITFIETCAPLIRAGDEKPSLHLKQIQESSRRYYCFVDFALQISAAYFTYLPLKFSPSAPSLPDGRSSAAGAQSGVSPSELKKNRQQMRAFLDAVALTGIDIVELVSFFEETENSDTNSSESYLPPLGLSVFLALAMKNSTKKIPTSTSQQADDQPQPAPAVMVPRILHTLWLFRKCISHLQVLLFNRSSPSQVEVLDKGLGMLDYLVTRLPEGVLTSQDLDSDIKTTHFHTTLLEFMQLIVVSMTTTVSALHRTAAYFTLRRLLLSLTEEARARFLVSLLRQDSQAGPTDSAAEETVFSGVSAMAMIGVTLLKDLVHQGWKTEGEGERNGKGGLRFFGGKMLRETFLSVLMDLEGDLYTGHQGSVLTSTKLFFERHGFLMHVLNLYLYVLLRDQPDKNEVGVWDPSDLESIKRKFLQPLTDKIADLSREVETAILDLKAGRVPVGDEEGDDEAEDQSDEAENDDGEVEEGPDGELDDLLKRSKGKGGMTMEERMQFYHSRALSLSLMESVLERIAEVVRTGLKGSE
ncbi:hypothetical protein HK102_013602 [Quaeritorhiza haematococci]|nr:hypothetical protein HK102_013602 [Quaeritorhiza haematococci]